MSVFGEIASNATGQGWEPGDLKATARSTPSAGWLVCDGSLVAQATYGDLFTAIGHAYNGGVDPGGGNFKLPDYRDKVLLGVSVTRPRGSTGGAETVLLTAAESGVPAHTHTTDSQGAHAHFPEAGSNYDFWVGLFGGGQNAVVAGAPGPLTPTDGGFNNMTDTAGAHTHTAQANATAPAASAHNNMQPYQASYVHIKT